MSFTLESHNNTLMAAAATAGWLVGWLHFVQQIE